MRLFVSILFLLSTVSCNASPTYERSDKIGITAITASSDAGDWLKDYVANQRKELPIEVNFNIGQVRAILITDMNVSAGHCKQHKPENILYLAVDPALNIKIFTTRIDKPCLHKRAAELRVQVVTKSEKRYFNIINIPKHHSRLQSNKERDRYYLI